MVGCVSGALAGHLAACITVALLLRHRLSACSAIQRWGMHFVASPWLEHKGHVDQSPRIRLKGALAPNGLVHVHMSAGLVATVHQETA